MIDLSVFGARRRAECFAVFIVLSFASLAAVAQNVVPNPSLDTQLSPWTAFLSSSPDPDGAGASPAWSATPDYNANPASGSALIDIDTAAPAADAMSGIAQCFDLPAVTPISSLNYAMSFLVPAATTGDNSISASVEVRLFSGTGCNGFVTGGLQGQQIAAGMPSDSSWYSLGDTNFVPPGAPVDIASIQMRGYLRQTGTAPTHTDYKVHVDRFALLLNGTTPVRLMQFDVE